VNRAGLQRHNGCWEECVLRASQGPRTEYNSPAEPDIPGAIHERSWGWRPCPITLARHVPHSAGEVQKGQLGSIRHAEQQEGIFEQPRHRRSPDQAAAEAAAEHSLWVAGICREALSTAGDHSPSTHSVQLSHEQQVTLYRPDPMLTSG